MRWASRINGPMEWRSALLALALAWRASRSALLDLALSGGGGASGFPSRRTCPGEADSPVFFFCPHAFVTVAQRTPRQRRNARPAKRGPASHTHCQS